MALMAEGLKWIIISVVVCVAYWLVSSTEDFFSKIYSEPNLPVEERQVDISDSRLSNFGSDTDPHLDSSDSLPVNRVVPLTTILNRIMNKICRKFSLYMQLEDKKIISLNNNYLNFTLSGTFSNEEVEKNFYGMNAMVSRLDSITRLGNAYISENTDSVICLIQKLRFQILKYNYDYYDEDWKLLGTSTFIYPKNEFILNVTLSTNQDNSACKVASVDLTFVPNSKSYMLKLNGISGTEGFYAKLEAVMFEDFNNKIVAAIKQIILPVLRKIVEQANMCRYFDAKEKNALIDSRDFTSVYVYDN